jgi:hypothetical protein
MSSFAIIAEGVTDQVVLENILYGYFHAEAEEDEPVVTHVQPPRDATSKGRVPAPGGWTLVFRSLRAGDHRKALQLNDYVIVHIDTDVSEEPGYDVSHRASDGRPLRPEELIEQVTKKLISAMDPEFCARNAGRIVFAIAVDSIECWLLPLLYDGEAAKKAKITGCLDAADWKLRRLNRPPLSMAGAKSLSSYEKTSRDYAKHRKLMEHRGENPSLDVFVKNLEALGSEPARDVGNDSVPGEDESSGTPGA